MATVFAETAYSIIAFAYLQPSLIPTPTLSRSFLKSDREERGSPSRPVTLDEVLDVQSELAEIFNSITAHYAQTNIDFGGSDDLKVRKTLYNDVCEWERRLLPQALFEPRLRYLHVFLKYAALKLQLLLAIVFGHPS